MRKKLLSILALLCLTVSGAWADGDCGDGVTWSLSGGTLTISKTGEGTGAMADYSTLDKRPWNSLTSSITNIVIENGVTSIGDNAFYICSNVTTVTIPSSVTSIGKSAFTYCYSVTTVTIPSSVTSIGMNAFYDCKNLTSVTVYARTCTLGTYAFDNCHASLQIYVFSDREYYYEGAENWSTYSGKIAALPYINGQCGTEDHEDNLRWVLTGTSPNYTLIIMKVGGTTSNMANYTEPVGATPVPWYSYMSYIKNVVIEEGVTTIGNYAFSDFEVLESVSIPSSVTTIGESAFYKSGINSPAPGITFTFADGSSLTSIGDFAFSANLTSISIPDGVTSIGNDAFMGSGLTSVTIPNSVINIGEEAFKSTPLSSVNIPASVKTIGDYAFGYCYYLTTVTFNSNPYISASAFSGIYTSLSLNMNLTANSAGGAYWTTFYNENYSFKAADASTNIFKGAVSGGNLELKEVADIPAGNAVILKSSDAAFSLTSTTKSADFTNNDLKGGTTVASGYDAYTLSRGSDGNGTLGFYKFSGASLDGNKAHLELPTGWTPPSPARSYISIGQNSSPTAIEASAAINGIEDGEVYDLSGRRINGQPTKKGIYVKNGQKFIVK